MENKEDGKSLEERAKKLLKEEIKKQPETVLVQFKIEHLEDNIPELNFMEKEGYILARGEAVREFFYEATPYGKRWALD
jgi:hypothetical protein